MYNKEKNLYIVHRKDTHEYLQEISTNWGFFYSCRLFSDKKYAESVLMDTHPELFKNGIARVLEGTTTKWAFKEPL